MVGAYFVCYAMLCYVVLPFENMAPRKFAFFASLRLVEPA